MKPIVLKHTLFLLFIISVFSNFISCGKNKKDEPEEPQPVTEKTVLVYSVVSNLNINQDKREMLEAAEGMDLTGLKLVIYQGPKSGDAQLLELKKDDSGNCDFVVIKDYSPSLYSTDPQRMREVISDLKEMYPANSYGLILWSHANGWEPAFSEHGTRSGIGTTGAEAGEMSPGATRFEMPELHSFGIDADNDRMDIDELASALPAGMFEYIWMDVCDMGNIEVAYQLRNKCDFFVGCPTEDPADGMPYNLTLPFLLKDKANLTGAAQVFFNNYYYVTVAVYDMSRIEGVADFCRAAYKNSTPPSGADLQKYSRNEVKYPLYDFGQYTTLMAESNIQSPDISEFNEAMSEFVVFKAASRYDFNFPEPKPIDQDVFSGLSCHLYNKEDNSRIVEYYRTLDWFKRVYE